MNIARLGCLMLLGLLVPALRAADSCCCEMTKTPAAAAAAAPLSGRSIYQLDGVWTNDAGRPFRLRELRGRPVVMAMFFTSCGYACPRIVAAMARIRQNLPPSVRASAMFVLVSFDTGHDTVPVLRAYREQHQLDSVNWVLLRGAPGDVRELAAVLGVKYVQEAGGMFNHSNLITVLNSEGEIVHQRTGLEGGLSEAEHAIIAANN
jgi:protein SCO1/2